MPKPELRDSSESMYESMTIRKLKEFAAAPSRRLSGMVSKKPLLGGFLVVVCEWIFRSPHFKMHMATSISVHISRVSHVSNNFPLLHVITRLL